MRKARVERRRRGYALVTSMVTILVLSVLASALLALSGTNLRISNRRLQGSQALNLAIGGMDDAVAALRQNGSYTGFSERSLGEGTVSVSVTTPNGQPDRRVVVSTGRIAGRGYTVERRVRTVCSLGQIPPVFYEALAAKRTFQVNGNVTVDSTPATGLGNVHSNEDVELKGSAVSVDGRATATGTVSWTGDPTVSRGMVSGVAPMVFPEVDVTFKEKALANGSTTPAGGTLTVNESSTVVKGKIVGNLSVGSEGCTLTGVVWVTGNVDVGGPILGKGTLVCDGTLSLDAKGTYPSGDLSNLLFITTSSSATAVDLGGNRSFKGSIYAPNGGAKLHGTPALLGSLLADTVTFSGNPHITRWTRFDEDPPEYPKLFQVNGWQEL